MKPISISALILAVTLVSGCDKPGPDPAAVAAGRQQEADTFNAFLAKAWEARLAESPELRSRLGQRTDYGKWDDRSALALDKRQFRIRTELANMLMLDYTKLDADQRESYELFENEAERRIELHRWRLYPPVIDQEGGLHLEVAAFLINVHTIKSDADADAYIARLRGIQPLFQQVEARLAASEAAGIVPPKFVFPQVASDIRGLLSGRPFDRSGNDSLLLKDFKDKVSAIDLPDERRRALIESATAALVESVKPAYDSLSQKLRKLEKKATDNVAASLLPSGDGYYRSMLRFHTTSDLSPGEMHDIGLSEVTRLQAEIAALGPTLGVKGALPELFKSMNGRPGSYYPDTDAGRAAYLKDATDHIEAVKARLGTLFSAVPADALVVKRVESLQARSAGNAFYQSATDDGSRPATYFVDLSRMTDMPKYDLESRAYHEGLPGHHLERSRARSLKALPEFRQFFPARAFTEGWALYAERLAKEIGGYATPEAEYGRLVSELDAAVELVVDTGIHGKKWTRVQSIKYFLDTTPMTRASATRAVERISVTPGRAPAATIGLLRILELRQRAQSELGDRFDIREFHDAVLANGPVPLNALTREVETYIERKRAPQEPRP
ncbi:MAG: DUF885 domain-containing protein [Steroidobacteraceae bacterium]